MPFSGQNCRSWNPADTGNQFECGQCEANYFIEDATANHTSSLCFGPIEIENCAEVTATSTSGNNLVFQCEKCIDGYFSFESGTVCLELDKVDFCVEYSGDSNRCVACETNFFIDYSGKRCLRNPEGIFGCEIYQSESECGQCHSKMYLFNGEYHEVDPPDWIDNCEYYSSAEICLACESGYFLAKNVCVEATGINCQSYADAKTCEECPEGYGFMSQGEVTNCVLRNVPNCTKSSSHYPFNCILCNPGFFESKGACFISDKVPNCLHYYKNKKCLVCNQGFVASLDRSKCEAVGELDFPLDSNCSNSFISPKRVCVACKPGFFLSEFSCKRCNTNDNCMFCDPSDAKKCKVCLPGTKLLSDGQCEGTPIEGFFDKSLIEEKPNKDLRATISSRVLSIFGMGFASLIFIL